MMNILVKAYYNTNLGDDLFLKILFDRYPNVNWTIETEDKKYSEIFKQYSNVHIMDSIAFKGLKKLRMRYLYYRKFDAFIYIGGSIFMQIDIWKKQLEERKKIWNVFKNKNIYVLGCNFGPYKNNEFYDEYKELFSKCTDICFRDTYSYKLFSELDNARHADDIVFNLQHNNKEKTKDSIGISVIDISDRKGLSEFHDAYVNKIKDLVIKAIDNNKTVTLISFCDAEGDVKAINEICSRVDEKYRKYVNRLCYDGNMDKFLDEYSSLESIVATRYHACILSMIFNQGLYPLIYSDKTLNVLYDLKFDEYYCRINNISDLNEDEILKKIVNNRIDDKILSVSSDKQFIMLDKYING